MVAIAEKKVVEKMRPLEDIYNVYIYLVWDEKISKELSFDDYVSLMRDLKTKAFISLWTTTINKMNILKIETDISPHVVMGVSNFVHERKTNAFDSWLTWGQLYNEWCNELPERIHENKRSFIRNKIRDGD